MYQFELIDQPNLNFDEFINTHPYGHLFQSYAWGKLKQHYGWQPLRLTFLKQNKIAAAISILVYQLLGSQTFFYAPRGPVMDFNNTSLAKLLMNKITAIAEEKKAVFLKIDPALPRIAYRFHLNLLELGFQPAVHTNPQKMIQLTHVFRINLPYKNPSHITLIKSMAQFNRLSVERCTTLENLKIFYGLLLEYSTITKIKIRSFGYYQRLWQLFQKTGVNLFFVRQKNYIIGASLLISFGNTCYSLYTVYRQSHLELHPESFLHLKIMEWAAASNYQIYEIMDTFLTTKKTSLATRLFSFPIEPYAYIGEYDLVYVPFQYKIWKMLLPIYNWSVKS